MKKVCLVVFVALLLSAPSAFAGEHRIGGGLNYWYTIDDIKDDNHDFDRGGLSIIASYQYWAGLLGAEVDLEMMPDRFDESAVSPQAYLLVGKGLYAGAGIGTTYSDGEFADEPFFALKGGFCLEVLPKISADIYANYRFNDVDDIDNSETDIDTDTLFFGAMVRFSL